MRVRGDPVALVNVSVVADRRVGLDGRSVLHFMLGFRAGFPKEKAFSLSISMPEKKSSASEGI